MEKSNAIASRIRNDRAFWRTHWIPLTAFGNWRAKFKAEPQPPVRKLLNGRRSHTPTYILSHMVCGCAEPIVPPAREAAANRM
jgi:hypothetical protein